MKFAFVFSVLIISIIQFIAIYVWNTIKKEKKFTENKNGILLHSILIRISHILSTYVYLFSWRKNSSQSAVLQIGIITGGNQAPSSHFWPPVPTPGCNVPLKEALYGFSLILPTLQKEFIRKIHNFTLQIRNRICISHTTI